MRGAFLRLNGKIYRACVQSVFVYVSEIWTRKVNDEEIEKRAKNTMLIWMCGVQLRDRKRTAELMVVVR